jgi:hypothetical protein
MWLEPDPRGSQWRGSIRHVPSGRRLFVVDTTDIADFITLQLEAPLAPSQSDES